MLYVEASASDVTQGGEHIGHGDRFRVWVVAELLRLGMDEDRQSGCRRRFEGTAEHGALDRMAPVIGERYRPSSLQCDGIGQLPAFETDGDRAHEADADRQRRTPGQQTLQPLGAICDRVGVRHGEHVREPTHRGAGCTRQQGLFLREAGFAQMRMQIHPPRREDEAGCVAILGTLGVDLDRLRRRETCRTQHADVQQAHQESPRSTMRTESSPSVSLRCTSTHSCRDVGTFLPM